MGRTALLGLSRRWFAGLLLLAVTALAGGSQAFASQGIDTGAASKVAIQVDSKGNAAVSWTKGGAPKSVVIPPKGKLTHGSLAGSDVSKPATVAGLPGVLTARKGADGTLYAVQAVQAAGRPTTLSFARWKGDPTELTLAVAGTKLTGKATFQGSPVAGNSVTLGGVKPKIYVYLDCFGCGGHASWAPMLGVAPKSNGSFSVFVRPTWKGSKYRATVLGKNSGSTYEPDAQTIISG